MEEQSTFSRLRRGGGGTPTPKSKDDYGFTGRHPRPRPTVSRTTTRTRPLRPAPKVTPVHRTKPVVTKPSQPPPVLEFQRDDNWDREPAYIPPAPRQDGHVQHFYKPTWQEILQDLAMRLLEVAIAAIAQEIVYFFTMRRFVPAHHYRHPASA